MSNGGVKLPDELHAAFEDLIAHDIALNAAASRFLEQQKAVVLKSRELWKETMAVMNLTGKYRYNDGAIYPVEVKQDAA